MRPCPPTGPYTRADGWGKREKLAAEADRLTHLLVERGAELLVAFGSFAQGEVGRASDLDLIAVMESDLPFIRRLERLYVELDPAVGLDLLVYTPGEFELMREGSSCAGR